MPETPDPDYRCKKCNTVVPRGTHLKMETCKCGAVQVDRGWYGSKTSWPSGKREDWIEELPSKGSNG